MLILVSLGADSFNFFNNIVNQDENNNNSNATNNSTWSSNETSNFSELENKKKNSMEFQKVMDNAAKKYDSYLRKWAGNYQWRLLYRASEHEYSGKSFHECCDDKGPTLIVIKSSGGWIFGGYTTRSWSGWRISNEMIY